MRALLVLLCVIVLLGGGGALYLRAHPKITSLERLSDLPERRNLSTDPPAPTPPPQNQVTIYLKNGGAVTGELVQETPQELTLRFDYGDVGFQRAEIERVASGKHGTDLGGMRMPWEGKAKQAEWSYRHDVVVKLMKGTVVDGDITAVSPEALTVTQALPGGGTIEHTIQRADVEELLFRPVANERSAQIEQTLHTVFPQMRWFPEGMFTIVTDSTPPTVKQYRRTIRELATDWYLTFHPLVKGRSPMAQHYVVIFEDRNSYIEYALTDGIPGWLAVGYFHPEDQVFYCFNMVGERFSDLLYEVYLGQFREARDRVSTEIKGYRYETFEQAKKKRQYLAASDVEQKRKLLEALWADDAGVDLSEVQAANSWVVEGLAGYMEPTPVGAVNAGRLAGAQEARRRQQIFPLEFLDAFRMGSFLRMAQQSALYAYAQSWAFCHFLMQRSPDGFLQYLDRLAREQPKEGEETLGWLLGALGKEQRPLEQEFLAYLEQFPAEDPFWLKQKQAFLDLRAELIALAHRLSH
ncbi:MAG: DUF1570 domain-containing protein [Candidatus Omnitrophica bacterium]|nr:DUF1570 domain-containing protein [Candidatus Omnitrophota bacterium]